MCKDCGKSLVKSSPLFKYQKGGTMRFKMSDEELSAVDRGIKMGYIEKPKYEDLSPQKKQYKLPLQKNYDLIGDGLRDMAIGMVEPFGTAKDMYDVVTATNNADRRSAITGMMLPAISGKNVQGVINQPTFKNAFDVLNLSSSQRKTLFEKYGMGYLEAWKKDGQPDIFEKGGSISTMGYKDNSPYKNSSSLMINSPNGNITMNGVSRDLIGTDEFGNTQYMRANSGNYQFQGNKIRETPVMQQGGSMGEYDTMGAVMGGLGMVGEGANYFTNKDQMTQQQKGKSLGSMIGGGLGLATSLLGVPPQIGMGIGSKLGGMVGGVIAGNEQTPIQTFNTTGIPKASNGLKLNNMNLREQYKQYQSGGQIPQKSYQQGGVASGEGAMPHSQGGMPAVDAQGNQIAEIEGGERIDSVEDTQTQEQIIMQIDQTPDLAQQEQLFMALGQFVYEMTKKQEQVNPSEGVPMEQDMQPPMGEQPMMKKGGKLKSTLSSYLDSIEDIPTTDNY